MPRLALMLCLAATPAFGHAILLESTPAPHAHVASGKLAVSFRYNSRIDAPRSKLTLTGPGAAGLRLPTRAGASPDRLQADATVTPGEYVLRWQVLAVDGHITRGLIPFSVDAH